MQSGQVGIQALQLIKLGGSEPPEGVGRLPVVPPHREVLRVEFSNGKEYMVESAVRCEGHGCTIEPGWMLVNGGVRNVNWSIRSIFPPESPHTGSGLGVSEKIPQCL